MARIISFILLIVSSFCESFTQYVPTDVVKLTSNFSVSDAGSVQYSIPITLPPGTGGMKPEFSFNYYSNGHGYWLGRIWHVCYCQRW